VRACSRIRVAKSAPAARARQQPRVGVRRSGPLRRHPLPNPHVGFGSAGPRFCLGAHLARRKISAMLRELLSRVPDIRAAGEPDRLLSSFIHGIKHLPCEFG
jgi:cytochrome P450